MKDPIVDTRTGKQVGVVMHSKECKLGCGRDALDFAGTERPPSGERFCRWCSGCIVCCNQEHPEMAVRRYMLRDTATNEDVFGPVGPDNVYLKTYGIPVNLHDKKVEQLEVGESTLKRYSLSGSSGVYRVVRVEDAP